MPDAAFAYAIVLSAFTTPSQIGLVDCIDIFIAASGT